ncbi:betaine--homocysteine S-methyltransferase 1-like [Ptychodera flava]|uniref:betaine--homocysteine S-methyltransferase 1-like n=1 Tax=Ptychodera flava TaxID=63121 RepID=UPI00396A26F6
MSKEVKGFMERLKDGESVIAAEGYLFYFERLGYLQGGYWLPVVILEHPEYVKDAYRHFVHAGSDVVEAFTYYAHREKLSLMNMEDKIELINREALRLGREVADETGTLLAGNICNTNIYHPDSPERNEQITAMFKEMIDWALDYKIDYVIGETFMYLGEAMLALEAIKKYGKGLPAVIMLAAYPIATKDGQAITSDGVPLTEACKKLEDAGADVVGLNCSRGPATMMPIMREIRKVCKVPLAALPVPYRTTPEEPTFLVLSDPKTGEHLFPTNLEVASCSHGDIEEFGKECKELGIQYVGICCGNRPCLTRTLAESLGRKPPGSRFSKDMSKNVTYGTDPRVKKDVAADNMKLYYNKIEV